MLWCRVRRRRLFSSKSERIEKTSDNLRDKRKKVRKRGGERTVKREEEKQTKNTRPAIGSISEEISEL